MIDETIIGENVRKGMEAGLIGGSLIADGVGLGKNARLGPFDRVSKRRNVEKKKQVNGVESVLWSRHCRRSARHLGTKCAPFRKSQRLFHTAIIRIGEDNVTAQRLTVAGAIVRTCNAN